MISWPPVGRPRPRGANTGRNDGIGSRVTERVEKDDGESERPVVSPRRGNHPEGPRGEKGTPCHDTVGGKHGGCIETQNRGHETTADRGTRSAKSRDGVHIPGLLHQHRLAAQSLPHDPQERCRGRRRRNGPGLRGEPGEQSPITAGPSQIRHVPGPTRASCVHSQGRLAWRDPPAGNSNLSFILHLFATGLGIAWRNSGPSVGPTLIMPPTAATMRDESVCASER